MKTIPRRGRKREGETNLRMTSVMVEPDIYEEFLEIIPRRKSVGEALREYMKEVVEENRKEKNLNGPNHSAVAGASNNTIQDKLDKYFPQHIMEWSSFKDIIEKLENEDRKKLTEIWMHDFRILELTNQKKTGSKVYPFVKGI